MSEGRLPAGLEAAAIRRLAEASGGHATVIQRGDSDRGVIVLLIAERGQSVALVERKLAAEGEYRWVATRIADAHDRIARLRRFDPDMWLIEVDVADSQRFIVESLGQG